MSAPKTPPSQAEWLKLISIVMAAMDHKMKTHQPPALDNLVEAYTDYVNNKSVSVFRKMTLLRMMSNGMYGPGYMQLSSTRKIMNKTELLMSKERTPRLLGFFETFTRTTTGFVAGQIQSIIYSLPGFVKGFTNNEMCEKLT